SIRNLQSFWPQRNDGKFSRRTAAKMVHNSLRREGVDSRLDFIKGADPAQIIPVRSECSGPRRRGLLLHDQRRLETCLDTFHFLRLDPFLKTPQFTERYVESFLRPLIGSAGITKHAGPI